MTEIAPRLLRLVKIYLMTLKYVLNLFCVNSIFARMPTTQENHPENCLPNVDTSSTEYTSGVISASCTMCSGGINSFMYTVSACYEPTAANKKHMNGFSPLILKVWMPFVATENGKDTNPQMFYSFSSSKRASFHIQQQHLHLLANMWAFCYRMEKKHKEKTTESICGVTH